MIEARQGQGEERDVNNNNVGPSPKQLDPFDVLPIGRLWVYIYIYIYIYHVIVVFSIF